LQFNLVTPCAECPFRRDVPGYLSPARAQQIGDAIVSADESFACHKTITVDHECQADEEEWDENWRPILDDRKAQFCAGALILLEKLGRPNRLPRIAIHLGMWDPDKMRHSELVFDSVEEMVQHMVRGR
jgi:hypothetical protein